MPSYPSLPQMESRPAPRSGVKNRIASNGQVRNRATQSATFYDWTLTHRGLTAAQWSTFKTFYDANRAGSFTVTLQHDASSLTCVWADKPYDVVPQPGGLYDVVAYLVQQS